jgi:hypothetical protein
MTTLFSSCPYDQHSLGQLSDADLQAKQAKIQRMGLVLLLLLLLIVSMALVLESYMIAVISWALIPALVDYRKRHKAIRFQLKQRNIA